MVYKQMNLKKRGKKLLQMLGFSRENVLKKRGKTAPIRLSTFDVVGENFG
jgi:DNA-binding Xre family transcriptional regulator